MNILLIGGGGYLGIPLSKELTKKGHNVVVFDNFKYNTQDLIECKIIHGDVGGITLRSDFHYPSFDMIFYLSQSRLNELDTEKQVETEIGYFNTFIKSFKWSGIYRTPKIYFISSCSTYGNTEENVNENSEVIPTSLYSKMKIECEKIITENKNSNFKILRLSTLYGNFDYSTSATKIWRNDVFINNIINDVIDEKSIEIYDPLAKRPHLHVTDCVKIITTLVNIQFNEPILNIGFNELNINKRELINIIKKIKPFEHIENLTNDSRNYDVDFSLLKKYVDFEHTNYEEGIRNYFNIMSFISQK
jgi:nucleoside-diphosphate-sugar epimerase